MNSHNLGILFVQCILTASYIKFMATLPVTNLKKTLTHPHGCENERSCVMAPDTANMSVIYHDMRTHLSPVKICAEMLKSGISGRLNEKQERMVDTIYRCTDRLEDLIKDFSDLHKLESGSLTLSRSDVDIQDTMDYYATILRRFIQGLHIDLKIEVGMHGRACLDKDRIGQVLISLVKNSVDHVSHTDGKISIRVDSDQSNILFTIEDNGEGIKSQDLENVFVKFYKGDSKRQKKYGGSGLGLTISRGIILEHGGKIWVDSRPGLGSTFRFTLPL